jgi:hypothetical protein
MLSSLVDWDEICTEEDRKAVGLGTLPEEPDGFEGGLLVEVLHPLHYCSCSPALTEVIVDACVVQIHSLVRKPEHNGKIARLLDYSREKDRWVRFELQPAVCVAASDVLNVLQTECEGVREYACAAS